jgi:hypothetical protein
MPKNEGPDADPDVELARKKALIAQIERKERMQAILDYTGLTVRIVFGLAFLAVSVLEFFYPSFLNVTSIKPEISFAIGVSFLSISQGVISKLEKVAKALKS